MTKLLMLTFHIPVITIGYIVHNVSRCWSTALFAVSIPFIMESFFLAYPGECVKINGNKKPPPEYTGGGNMSS